MKRLLILVLMLTGCAFGQYMEAGDNAAKAGRWEAAYQSYARAAADDTDSKEAREKRDAARYQWLMLQANEARADADRGDTLGAIVAARKAAEIWPEHAEAVKVVEDVSAKVTQHASRLVGQKDYANAVMLHEAAIRELPGMANVHTRQADAVKSAWQSVLAQEAEAAEASSRQGDALLLWAKISQLSTDVEHRRKFQVLRSQIQAEMAYRVRLSALGRDANPIVARLSTFKRGTLEVDAQPTSSLAETSIQFQDFRVSEKRESLTATVEYQDGVRQVPNPTYASRLSDVQDDERRLAEAENEVNRAENKVIQYEQAVAREGDTPNTSTGAEQNLTRAQSDLVRARDTVIDKRNDVIRSKDDLSRQPQFVDEPVYRSLTYPVTRVTKTATATLTVLIKHPDGRPANKVSERISTSSSDDTHDAQQVAGVAADPLNLPGNNEMLTNLHEVAIERSRAAMLKDFAEWRTQLLESAIRVTNPDQRVDALVRYVITDPKSADVSAATELTSLRKISDVIGVLSAP